MTSSPSDHEEQSSHGAGATTGIWTRQAHPEILRLIRAYSRRYTLAHRLAVLRDTVTLGLAAATPFVGLFLSQVATWLGLAAGAWLILDRLLVARRQAAKLDDAVAAQELYDTTLFDLPWNTALVGRQPAPEELAEDAARQPELASYRTWYSDTSTTPRPLDVLLCQRQNTVWSRRLHTGFATVVETSAATWFVVGIAFAVWRDFSLAAYLAQVFLPSAPAYVAAIDLRAVHRSGAAVRTRIQEGIASRLDRHREGEPLTIDDCRRTQDAIYLVRRDFPGVPGWYYRLRKQRDQVATDAGVRAYANMPSAQLSEDKQSTEGLTS